MRVAIGSAFRNSRGYLPRYFGQVAALQKAGVDVRVIAAEGDSTDGTRQSLIQCAMMLGLSIEVIPADHGGPVFGSTEEAARMDALSKIGDTILSGVNDRDDVLLYVESDLIWDPQTAITLIQYAAAQFQGYDVFSPLVFAGQHFYDVWGMRGLDGSRFAPFPPYHSTLKFNDLTEVSSVGSCLAMRVEVAMTSRMNGGCLVGFCEQVRAKGSRIAVDSRLRVDHPC